MQYTRSYQILRHQLYFQILTIYIASRVYQTTRHPLLLCGSTIAHGQLFLRPNGTRDHNRPGDWRVSHIAFGIVWQYMCVWILLFILLITCIKNIIFNTPSPSSEAAPLTCLWKRDGSLKKQMLKNLCKRGGRVCANFSSNLSIHICVACIFLTIAKCLTSCLVNS